ncbi:hypothetical protein FACS1894123_11400 [Bacteroidia bacterium]|nr:hypothetical protein FACS1894123_11400 [Bacteroidia bacterium]
MQPQNAKIAQLVEHDLAKVGVAGSSPVFRSTLFFHNFIHKKNCIFALSGQTPNNESTTRKAVLDLYAQILVFPQEKIYLQTDRPYYVSGEKIFFRAFVLHASTREIGTLSRYVYVELVSANNSVALRQKIRIDDDLLFYGALALPEALSQGNYRIRAYTRYMENIGEAYFYSRPVFVADPKVVKTGADAIIGNTSAKNAKIIEVNFYPEGGNLIAGQPNHLAFKALLPDGSAAEIKGAVQCPKRTDAEFLLASELAGNIRQPAWYFRNDDEKTVQAADLLMLTHGWRRYHVAEALQENLQKPATKPEVSQSFTGVLKGRTGKPYKDGKIKMMSLGYDFSEIVQSDENGRYVFDNFEFPDSTAYFFLSYTEVI